MVTDIASLDMNERPVLALENLDETPIAILGNAFNIEMHIAYNDMSEITFDLPAWANGQRTPGYDDVIGTRLIRFAGVGVFILVNPEVTGDGIREIKTCKAYSREYEMTYKKMSLEENTYNLWNPVMPDSTILGIIVKEYLPYWHIGTVDSDLIGKYRTFSESNVNLYNFLKSTVQQKYGCIVEFDTVLRRINVRSTANHTATAPVFLSLNNLVKEIEREEDTENIFTCLDVNGADGVTIRGVNPTGTNKLYNLDYFMNTSHFPRTVIDKWTAWKEAFEAAQPEYHLLTIERMLKTSEIVFAQSRIDDSGNAELKALEAEQSVYIEYLARANPDSSDYAKYEAKLRELNAKIAAKKSELAAEGSKVSALEREKDALTAELERINRSLDFGAFFTDDEVLLLRQYFKEDSISDSSFVYAEAKNYTGEDETRVLSSSDTFRVSGGTIEETVQATGRIIVSITGGSVVIGPLSAGLIRATAEYDPSAKHTVFTAYLSSGVLGTNAFPDGCLTAVTDGGSYSNSGTVSFAGGSGRMYFTRNTTEYEKFSVEWDLYQYGAECLSKLAYPSYSFSLDSANFLSMDVFAAFKNQLKLGQKIYLDMDDGTVLEPIFIGFEVEWEDLSALKLEFGDKYCIRDPAFALADLLNQSVSMGKTVDTSRFGYNAFIDSGASTAVKDYMDAALDVSKQAILSSGDIAISWDGSGMKFRKWNAAHTDYEPEQIAIINNNIVFTDDGWQTAKMAVGHFYDTNKGDSWGIVAPNIVGTLLAGENLVIESTKQDGGVSVFKVDADGAVLHNSKFDIVRSNFDKTTGEALSTSTPILLDPDSGFGIGTYPVADADGNWNDGTGGRSDYAKFWVDMQGNVHLNNGYIELLRNNAGSGRTQILLDPELGFGIGAESLVTTSYGVRSWNTDNARFWVDTAGNLHLKGTLEAADGHFSGDVTADGVIKARRYEDSAGNNMFKDDQFGGDWLNLKGVRVLDNNNNVTFEVKQNGDVTVRGDIELDENSVIYFGDGSHTKLGDELARKIANGGYSGGSFISNRVIYGPTIISNELIARPESLENNRSSGHFKLQDYYGQDDYLDIHYFYGDTGPAVHFTSYGPVQSGVRVKGLFQFNSPTFFYENVYFQYPARFYDNIILQSGETYGTEQQRKNLSASTGMLFFQTD